MVDSRDRTAPASAESEPKSPDVSSQHRARLLPCLAALAVLALPAAGCGPGEPAEPAARLEVTPGEVVLPYPGAAVLTVTWAPSAPLEDHPIVFVHLLGADGGVVRTFDHLFPEDWVAGSEVTYPLGLWQSALGPPLPDGAYDLSIGVYTPDGHRPALEVEGREVDDGEYVVARVEAPPVAPGGPRLAFGDGWEMAAPPTDRQTFGARWLGDGGSLELVGVDGPLDLALSVRLPAPDEMESTLVLDPDATEPAVEISSPCTAEPVRVAGAGTHEVTLALRPAEGVGSCPVVFGPGFVYLDPQTLRRLSVDLRRVLWAPGSEPEPDAEPEPAEPAAAAAP